MAKRTRSVLSKPAPRIITASLTLGPAQVGLPLTFEEIISGVPRLVLAFQNLGIIPRTSTLGLTIGGVPGLKEKQKRKQPHGKKPLAKRLHPASARGMEE